MDVGEFLASRELDRVTPGKYAILGLGEIPERNEIKKIIQLQKWWEGCKRKWETLVVGEISDCRVRQVVIYPTVQRRLHT